MIATLVLLAAASAPPGCLPLSQRAELRCQDPARPRLRVTVGTTGIKNAALRKSAQLARARAEVAAFAAEWISALGRQLASLGEGMYAKELRELRARCQAEPDRHQCTHSYRWTRKMPTAHFPLSIPAEQVQPICTMESGEEIVEVDLASIEGWLRLSDAERAKQAPDVLPLSEFFTEAGIEKVRSLWKFCP